MISGFAGMKFSGSMSFRLKDIDKVKKIIAKVVNDVKSFRRKNEWNGILSLLEFRFILFDDPLSWRTDR